MTRRTLAGRFRAGASRMSWKLLVAFVAVFLGAVGAGALLAEEVPWTDKFMREFSEIRGRLEKIQKRQQEISEKQDKIQAELDRLRVWVRRR